MVDGSGSHGWAVGGFVNPQPELGTADVRATRAMAWLRRRPARPGRPTAGRSRRWRSAATPNAKRPCAAEQNAKLGPDVWLTSAMSRAFAIPGVQRFLDTGTEADHGRDGRSGDDADPVREELQRFQDLLAPFPNALPVPSPSDTVGAAPRRGSEPKFVPPELYHEECAVGCAYYAFNSDPTGNAEAHG